MIPAPPFRPGDPVPWFNCRATNNDDFSFNTVAGRYVVLCFFGSASAPGATAVLEHVHGPLRPLLDDSKITFFGVTTDPADEKQRRVQQEVPGIRYFYDFDSRVSRLYGTVPAPGQDAAPHGGGLTLVLDPALRVLAVLPHPDPARHNRELREVLEQLPPVDDHAGTQLHAPVLIVPRVLDPELCRELVKLHQSVGGRDSGFMRDRGGATVEVIDHGFKRRTDCEIPEGPLREAMRRNISRRLVPEIARAFQYHVTHIERYIVACYDSDSGGFFRPHRDNTTLGTAHRRFAVTINLNAGEYSGGGLRFPEFGSRIYQAPAGGAVVFSCSLLHEAMPVVQGRRYATLPFLYDGRAARVRRENSRFLSGEVIRKHTASTGRRDEGAPGPAGTQ